MSKPKLPTDPRDYYVHSDCSLEELSKLYNGTKGSSLDNLKKRSRKENWSGLRHQNNTRTALKKDEKLTSIRAEQDIDFIVENPLLSKERLLEELTHIAYSNVADILTVEDGGEVVYKPFSQVPESAKRSIKKIKEKRRILEDEEGKGTILDSQFEMDQYDKLKAIGMITELMGYKKTEGEKPPDPSGLVKPPELSYTQFWNMTAEQLLLYNAGQYFPPPDEE